MLNYEYVSKNLEEFSFKNVMISAVSKEGIVLDLIVPESVDFLDFIEELGIYFYRIDDPKFGQKFINEETKLYIYDWLVQFLNTGNYEEDEISGGFLASFELLINFDKLNTFKYALHKYKVKYKQDLKHLSETELVAEETAINILEMVEKLRLVSQ